MNRAREVTGGGRDIAKATSPMFGAWSKPARSLRYRVVDAIREAIVTGQLKPGSRVLEERISQEMDISRGPIREALRQLEQEGLIFSFPHRGAFVADISPEAVTEVLMPVRLALELCGFRHSVEVMGEREYAHLAGLIQHMEEAAHAGQLNDLVDADIAFHAYVMARSEQIHAIQIWNTISPRVRAFFYKTTPHHRQLIDVAQEHRDLVRTMRSADDRALKRMLHEHILVVPRWANGSVTSDTVAGAPSSPRRPRPRTVDSLPRVEQ